MSQHNNSYPIPQRSSLYRQQMQTRRSTQPRNTGDDDDDPYLTPRSVVRYRPTNDGTLQGLPKMSRSRRLPWYFYVSSIIAGIVLLYIVIDIGGSWIQHTRDDWTYGNPRTYQTDANVGHGTSQAPMSQANKTITARIQSQGVLIYQMRNLDKLKTRLAGRNTQQALQLLRSLPTIENVQITGIDQEERLPKNAGTIHLVVMYGI